MLKKIIPFVLAAIMMVSLVPTVAFAEDNKGEDAATVVETQQYEDETYETGEPRGDEAAITENDQETGEEVNSPEENPDISEGNVENETEEASFEDVALETSLEAETTKETSEDVANNEDNDETEETVAETEEDTASVEETTQENNKTNAKKAPAKKDVAIKSIKLNVSSKVLTTNSSFNFKATISPSNATDAVVWESSNKNVASVDANGKVTAHHYGQAVITAKAKSDGKIKATCKISTRYYDVNNSKEYYYKPIYWAVNNKIVAGYLNGSFGPEKTCTRKDFIVFLWRYSGRPASSAKVTFTDVKLDPNTESYKAMSWAESQGIAKGDKNNKFYPNSPVVRKTVTIMLWRMAGKPRVSGSMKYSDVVAQKYSKSSEEYKSILWALYTGIAKGYKGGIFKPLSNCTRADIMTCLYRFKDNKNKMSYLAMPSNLKAVSGEKRILLSWQKVSGAKEYWVYYRTSKNATYKKVATTKSSSYIFTKVTEAETYAFRVIAVSGQVESDYQEPGITSIYLKKPPLKSATAVTNGITVKWSAVKGAKGYKVYRKTASSGWKILGNTTGTSYTDTTCASGVKYTYTIRAFKKDGDYRYFSGYEAGKSATFTDPVMVMARNRLKASGGSLKSAYNWSVRIGYRNQPYSSTCAGYAKWTFQNGVGDCLGKAATFAYMAKALGYQVNLIYGYVPRAGGGTVDHGWVEIYSNGSWYVCDPDFEYESGRNGYFIHYGQSGTWMYNKSHVIKFK